MNRIDGAIQNKVSTILKSGSKVISITKKDGIEYNNNKFIKDYKPFGDNLKVGDEIRDVDFYRDSDNENIIRINAAHEGNRTLICTVIDMTQEIKTIERNFKLEKLLE